MASLDILACTRRLMHGPLPWQLFANTKLRIQEHAFHVYSVCDRFVLLLYDSNSKRLNQIYKMLSWRRHLCAQGPDSYCNYGQFTIIWSTEGCHDLLERDCSYHSRSSCSCCSNWSRHTARDLLPLRRCPQAPTWLPNSPTCHIKRGYAFKYESASGADLGSWCCRSASNLA